MRPTPEEVDAAEEFERISGLEPGERATGYGDNRWRVHLNTLAREMLALREELREQALYAEDQLQVRDQLRAKVERVEAVLEGYNAFLEDIGPLAGELVPSGSGEVAAYRVVVSELEAALLDEGES